jgi:undecaprenyl-diphosphatase
MAAAVVLAVYMIFAKRLHSISLRLFLLIACLSWALLIAFSRIYLDVHWLSDVIAGLGLGIFWVTLLTLLREWYRTA